MERITQNQIKYVRSLQQKKFRNEHNQFIAEGPKIVGDLIGSKFLFNHIFAKREWIEQNLEKMNAHKIPFSEINNKELGRISGLVTPNSVVAVIQIPEAISPSDILGNELILVLDGIRDPGNLGTIIRTADWFGINHIICSEDSVDVYNPKVVQATMGSLGRANVHYTGLLSLFKENADKAVFYGTFMDGTPIYETKPESKGVIVIGNESAGISKELQHFIHHRVSIPLFLSHQENNPESLNAAVVAGIMSYEFRKKI